MNEQDDSEKIDNYLAEYSQSLWNSFIDNESETLTSDQMSSFLTKAEAGLCDARSGRGWSALFLELWGWWDLLDIAAKKRILQLALEFCNNNDRPEDEIKMVSVLANEWWRELYCVPLISPHLWLSTSFHRRAAP